MAVNCRWATRRALVEALGHEDVLTGIPISLGAPGEVGQREDIWLGPSATTGTLNVPVFTGPDTIANPVTYDDRFTIPVHIFACAPGQTLEEAEARGEQLYLAVERVVRQNPQLSELDEVAGLVSVLLEQVVIVTANFQEGVGSIVDVTLACHGRISGGAT